MEKIQANMILEVLGRPKENVSSALAKITDKLATEKGVKVLEKNLHEPVSVENSKDLFTTFAELTIEFETLESYFMTMFAYMPSNLQIITPEKLTIKNDDLTLLGNRLMQRLHDYDAVVKRVLIDRDIVVKKLQEVAPNLFENGKLILSNNQKNTNPEKEAEQKEVPGVKEKSKKSKKKK